MKSRFACPHCGSGLPASDVMRHAKFRCRSCGTLLSANQPSVVIGVATSVGLMFSLAHFALAAAGARGWSNLAFWSLAICLYVLASLAAYAMAVRIIRVDQLEDSGH